MLLKVQFYKQTEQAKHKKKPTNSSELIGLIIIKKHAYSSIVNSTGQWSEPNTSVWILASTNLSFKEAEVTK